MFGPVVASSADEIQGSVCLFFFFFGGAGIEYLILKHLSNLT